MLGMKQTRRNIIIGGGVVVGGLGVAVATGAFTTVEAERTANVNVVDDDVGFLRLLTAETEPTGVEDPPYDDFQNQDFVSVDEEGGTQGQDIIQFHFDEAGGGEDGEGLNDDAVTAFNNVFMIENQSGQTIELDYEVEQNEEDVSDAVDLYYLDGEDRVEISGEILEYHDEPTEEDHEAMVLYAGFEFDTRVDLTGINLGDDDVDVRIIANTVET